MKLEYIDVEQLSAFLVEWFLQHTAHVDTKLANYIQSQE